jgi:hypothetical protein
MNADIVAAAHQLTVLYADASPDAPGALQGVLAKISRLAPGGALDAIPALVAERFRIEADAAANIEENDDKRSAAILVKANKLQEPLENQIADNVASSPAGLCAQLWLLRELIVANGQNDRDERIFRSLLIGIMQTKRGDRLSLGGGRL